ncbi:MAG: ribulose-phosphate 3-epimerase [Flavobacteriaceae bacterium]|jgi:ribulose-phosphate 3-epimerase
MNKTNKIIPAIMPKNLEDMKQKISLVEEYVEYIQLDLMDGEFVPEKTWLPSDESNFLEDHEAFFKDAKVNIELDLMVKNAMNKMDYWLTLHPKRVIFHIDAEEHFDLLFEPTRTLLSELGIEMYIAVHVDTPLEELDDYLPFLDGIQCMGIEKVGYQGEGFDERVLSVLQAIRSVVGEEMPLSVDGAVNEDTIDALKSAGATHFVSGSYIYGSSDTRESIDTLANLAE